jgi:SSS family transporter
MAANFHLIDGLILVAYLAMLTGIGLYFSRRQTNLEEFFLAGRTMAWLPVGLSLMAALNSGIDYLMQPSATIKYGLILLAGTTSWLLLYPWVSRVTLPFYRRLGLYTAYEYLERRFDVRVRSLAAGIFLLWRLGWMATAMYVPCLAVSEATGGRVPLVPTIVVLGVVVTLYTMLGGIKAVIWTDVLQFCVMFGGLAATVAIVTASVPGGVGEVFGAAFQVGAAGQAEAAATTAGPGLAGDLVRFFTQPVTLIGLLVATMVSRMTTYTADQVMVQRFQTTRSLRDSRQAFIINGAGDALWMLGLSFVGLALYAYSQHHPFPAGLGGDKVLPRFIAHSFPAGAVGLVVAAIFAASLSSIDSAINSCTSVVTVDFYSRLLLNLRAGDPDLTPEQVRGQVRVSRAATLLCGLVGIALAMNVGRIGDLIEVCNKVINAFTGPLFGIFLLGMFTHRARSGGVLTGGLLGTLVTLYVAFLSPLSFLWPSAFGLVTTLAVGYALALLAPPQAGADDPELTWWRVMKLPEVEDPASPLPSA